MKQIEKIVKKVQGTVPCMISKYGINSLVPHIELILAHKPSLEEWAKIRRKVGKPILVGKSHCHMTVFI